MSSHHPIFEVYPSFEDWWAEHIITMDWVWWDLSATTDLITEAWVWWNGGDDHAAIGTLIGICGSLNGTIGDLGGMGWGGYYRDVMSDGFRMAKESSQVTAEAIMAAWIDADDESRLMTVLTMDELRRYCWNMEFFEYNIAEPRPI